jgi:hypothetical protein
MFVCVKVDSVSDAMCCFAIPSITMSISTIISQSPPYSRLFEEVEKSLSDAECGNSEWFALPILRSKTFQKIFEKEIYYDTNSILSRIKSIWGVCIYTAPVVLTQIAPPESYAGNEDAILGASFADFKDTQAVLQSYPEIETGVEPLKKKLSEDLGENQGKAFLCNLFGGTHVFVIEARSNDKCVIYQSYVSGYTFNQFLKDDVKHVEYKPEKLVKKLNQIVSRDEQMQKRVRAYQKLFFEKLGANSFKRKDISYEFPLIFVRTSPYPLRKD